MNLIQTMPKWKKNAKEFVVSVTHNSGSGTSFSYIPKPILELLDNPNSLKFIIKGRHVEVESE